MLELTERRLREEILTWPDASVSVEGLLDNDGIDLEKPVCFAATVSVESGTITFDFRASDDQDTRPGQYRRLQGEGAAFMPCSVSLIRTWKSMTAFAGL